MATERKTPIKEILLDEVFLIQEELEPAGQGKILDETGNPIRDHLARFVYDD
jgi:hypothetical protein